ncbi:hypothetical protein OG453_00205 [Streptomyces sp. NBC_01381]|uniref:hypothetical protein n=1 Tax=Streptomyces sp. NBC_01381 TaxID=2903845 RepID=UPI00224CF34C|nr:hypothetical protein [Streptomyces sp. NBC_01381]MCX4665107.1 hypothetical protein [Streptomyces sp. NBC_01381]
MTEAEYDQHKAELEQMNAGYEALDQAEYAAYMHELLAKAIEEDNRREAAGIHGDDRRTCWTHQCWADECAEHPLHTHPLSAN